MQIDLDALERRCTGMRAYNISDGFIKPDEVLALIAKVRELEQDAARWRHAVENWRICKVWVIPGVVSLTHPRGIPWDDLTHQVDTAIDVARGGKEHG